MSKKTKVKENDAPKEEPKKDECPAEPAKKEAAPEEKPHDDEAQDRALIQKMIAEYLGDDMKDQEEVMQMAKEAYESYREMGYESDKAIEAAGHALKLAKHMSGKTEAKKEECAPGEVPKKEEAKKEAAPEKEEEKKETDVKESAIVLTLKAQVAALQESMRAIDIEKHLEKTLRESGLPRTVTAVFKEHLGAPKSTADIDDKFKLFIESYKAAKGSETGVPFVISTEKREGGKAAMSFADCINN